MKALVLGGSGAIGQAIVTSLLEKGFEVIVHYHQCDVKQLNELYHNQPVQFVQADLSCLDDDLTPFSFIQNLDVLIYASGQSMYGLIQDALSADIDKMYQLHVKSLMRLTQYFLSQLQASPQGRVIVISSIWGETGASFETVYSTMKAAQLGFVKSLAKELSLTNVTVNAIAPGVVKGRMTDELSRDDQTAILESLPQERFIDPNEIAHACQFLVHPNAKSITGTVQRVNGGWYV